MTLNDKSGSREIAEHTYGPDFHDYHRQEPVPEGSGIIGAGAIALAVWLGIGLLIWEALL